MSDTPGSSITASVLLATDLSARSDRALDRAVMLARHWRARLIVLSVIPSMQELDFNEQIFGTPPWKRPEQLAQQVERQLRRDLGGLEVSVHARVEAGTVGPTVLRVAREERAKMIVVGVARNEIFAEPSLGSTAGWLARHASEPILVVQRRPRHAYRSMALATDFSSATRHALWQTLSLFGEPLSLALVHGFEASRIGARDVNRHAAVAQQREHVETEAHQFIDALKLSSELRLRTLSILDHADPVRLLRDYVRDHDIELAIIASHGRNALFDLLLGSVAQRMLATVQTDMLIVREPDDEDSVVTGDDDGQG